MGCGSSSQVLPAAQQDGASGNKINGTRNGVEHGNDHDRDDLSTVILTDTPVKKRPPIAFEIPLEDSSRMEPRTPPPHLQRLLQPAQPEVTSSNIEERLAEAEGRRQMILQQRAASARKRTQKMMRAVHAMKTEHSDMGPESMEPMKRPPTSGALPLPPERGVCEGKNI